MKIALLRLGLLALIFITQVLSSSLGEKINGSRIIEKILDQKLDAMRHAAKPCSARISPAMEFSIKQNDLLSAVVTAIFEQDIAARNVLCQQLLGNHQAYAQCASDAAVISALFEQVDDVAQIVINGESLLHYACRRGRADIVKALLPKAKDINESNRWPHQTSLMLALRNGHGPVAKTLLRRMRDVDQADLHGDTPMHFAAENGLVGILQILLDKTKLINQPNQWGMTPLMLALRNGHAAAAMLLLWKIDDVDQEDVFGDTPLHYAALSGLVDAVKVILEKTKLINKPNKNGDTPLMLAQRKGNSTVAKLIMSN